MDSGKSRVLPEEEVRSSGKICDCLGSGVVVRMIDTGLGWLGIFEQAKETCPKCKGSGVRLDEKDTVK